MFQPAVITFVTFDYDNGPYSSMVELNLVQNSKFCAEGYSEAAAWLESQGFTMTENPDVWVRGEEKQYDQSPYTLVRALITGISENPDMQTPSYLCSEGHME